MNTVKSFWIGMGALTVAGGSAYYFAKRSINEERTAKFHAQEERARRNAILEQQHYEMSSAGAAAARYDHSCSPSSEANIDPAPTRHAPETDAQRIREKSKFEASEPYSSRKGDRFS